MVIEFDDAVWRKAGSDCAEPVLIAARIQPDAARQPATMQLPPLPALVSGPVVTVVTTAAETRPARPLQVVV